MVKPSSTPRSSSFRKRSAALGDDRPACCASSFSDTRAFAARISRMRRSSSSSIGNPISQNIEIISDD
ncbi:hypothetical protein D3C72_2359130 [compost metagenome]